VLTQLTVPGEARPLKIAPEAIYTSSFFTTAFWMGGGGIRPRRPYLYMPLVLICFAIGDESPILWFNYELCYDSIFDYEL